VPKQTPTSHFIRRKFLGILASVGAVSLTVALLGSNSAYGSPSGSSIAKVTGAPVPVGIITDAGAGVTLATGPLVETGAKMAVQYFNQNGGLAGRPIKLFICENQETPAGGQVCANQMVQDKVVAVVLPFTGQGASEVPTITAAGIPYMALSGESTQELTTTNAFAITGGFPGALATDAMDSKTKGFKKFAMLTSNVPTAIQGAQVLGGMVFKNAGVAFKVIPVAVGTADMTPQLQSAVSWGASAIGITGDLTQCTAFLKGYQTLALNLPKYLITTCIDKSLFPSLGSVVKGSLLPTDSAAGPVESKIYANMTKDARGVSPNPNVSANQAQGAASVWALVNAMKGYTGSVTGAAVINRLQTAKNVPIPLSGGLTFTCNGTAVPILKSICSVQTKLGVLTATGKLTNLKTYNPAALFKS
jgi:branched-chain amino acid transport system substrate-binding protein